MSAIADEGSGLVIYEYQEGPWHRADGEAESLRLAGPGLDTIEANEALGLTPTAVISVSRGCPSMNLRSGRSVCCQTTHKKLKH